MKVSLPPAKDKQPYDVRIPTGSSFWVGANVAYSGEKDDNLANTTITLRFVRRSDGLTQSVVMTQHSTDPSLQYAQVAESFLPVPTGFYDLWEVYGHVQVGSRDPVIDDDPLTMRVIAVPSS